MAGVLRSTLEVRAVLEELVLLPIMMAAAVANKLALAQIHLHAGAVARVGRMELVLRVLMLVLVLLRQVAKETVLLAVLVALARQLLPVGRV